jgi:uncharacterized heparinase superfamily protein
MLETPRDVWVKFEPMPAGIQLISGHDGYVPTHGLTHIRELAFSQDGRMLEGTDTLGAMSAADRRHYDEIFERGGLQGTAFDIRFHLHPDVDAALDMGGAAVSMALKSGEIWIFRHDGIADLRLEPSVYLEKGRMRPRAAQQIVLSARVLDFACQIGWTLSKAQDTPAAIRDIDRDPLPNDD